MGRVKKSVAQRRKAIQRSLEVRKLWRLARQVKREAGDEEGMVLPDLDPIQMEMEVKVEELTLAGAEDDEGGGSGQEGEEEETSSDMEGDIEGEGEAAVSASQLERAAKACLIDQPRTSSRASSEFCFVCVTPTPIAEGEVTEDDRMFLLGEMLELPSLHPKYYLDRMKEPESWIGLCGPCLEVVREGARVRELIKGLEQQLWKCRGHIVRQVQSHKHRRRLALERRKGEGEEDKEQRQAVENVLQYAYKRKYQRVMKGPVFGGQEGKPAVQDKAKARRQILKRARRRKKKVESSPVIEETCEELPASPQPPGSEDDLYVHSEEEGRETIEDEVDEDDDDEDPLAGLEDNQEEEEEEGEFFEPLKTEPLPAPKARPVRLHIKIKSNSQLFYCGLCDDDKIYTSEKKLQSHTDEAHRPVSPSPRTRTRSISPNKRGRKRKQTFASQEEVHLTSEKEQRQQLAQSPRLPPPSPVNLYKRERAIPSILARGRRRKPLFGKEDSTPYAPVSEVMPKELEEMEETLQDHEGDPEQSVEREAEPEAEPEKKGWYDCPSCPDVRSYGISQFIQHLSIHRRRPFKCSLCLQFLSADEDLREQHWKEKHPESEVEASKRFLKVEVDPEEIQKCGGVKDEGEPSNYSCQVCSAPSSNLEGWRLHRALHHPELDSKSCFYCDKDFAQRTVEGLVLRNDEKMTQHIREDHANELSKYYIFAGRTFDECEPCGVVLGGPRESLEHFRDKHGIPLEAKASRFSCPICQRGLADGKGLRRHLATVHFSAEEKICDKCGEKFSGGDQLMDHRFREHGLMPEDGQVFSCPVEGCGYKTVIRKKFHWHKARHANPQRHICKYCGKAFKCSSKLSVHLDIHENKEKKPYQCEICGNSFAVRNYLYIHKRLSHEGRTFPSTNKPKGPRSKKNRKETEVEGVGVGATVEGDNPNPPLPNLGEVELPIPPVETGFLQMEQQSEPSYFNL